MRSKKYLIYLTLPFLLFLTSNLFAQVTVVPDRANATYSAGEQMHFVCNTHITGLYSYSIFLSVHTDAVIEGFIDLVAGEPKKIPFRMDEPGHVYCRIKIWTNDAICGATFSPWEIEGSIPTPTDFNAFWNSQKALLGNVPINEVITPYDTTLYSKSYKMRLDNIDGRKVWGYVSVPNGPGPFVGIINMPPFGIIKDITIPESALAERGGAIVISLSIHDNDPEIDAVSGYIPDDYSIRDENYYRWGLIGAVRAIDYLFTRPDFDGQNVGVTGVSQGGGLSILMAGIDSRIKAMSFTLGTLCGHSEYNFEKASGLPYYLRDSKGVHATITHENATVSATQYYDGIHCLKQFNGPVFGSVSYGDTISPPATVFAAINSLSSETILIHSTVLSHWTPPQYNEGVLPFFKKQFPSMIANSTWPWANSDTGLYISAGTDQMANANTPYSLSGELGKNGVPNIALPVQWEKASGPGKVNFSNANNRNASVTFSTPGTYVLKFSSKDETLLNTDDVFYTLHDFVTIQVGP